MSKNLIHQPSGHQQKPALTSNSSCKILCTRLSAYGPPCNTCATINRISRVHVNHANALMQQQARDTVLHRRHSYHAKHARAWLAMAHMACLTYLPRQAGKHALQLPVVDIISVADQNSCTLTMTLVSACTKKLSMLHMAVSHADRHQQLMAKHARRRN